MVRDCAAFVAILVLAAAGCTKPRRYELRGQVVAVDPARQQITIRHEDIRGFMPGMTMPFRVRETALLEGRTPGDLVTARLVVEDADTYLAAIRRTGHSPLADVPPPAPPVGLERPGTGRHIHIHTMSASQLLPFDGP